MKRREAIALIGDRDGWKCHYCDTPIGYTGSVLEHKTPRSKSGSNKEWNLALACRRCDKAKGNMSYDEFIKRNKSGA